jgi:hypothetical protein
MNHRSVEISEDPVARDLTFIAVNMRAEDRREIYATRFREDPVQIGLDGLNYSFKRWSASHDGQPVACGGASEVAPGVAKVWMFATDRWSSVSGTVSRYIRDTFIPDLMALGVHRAECLSIEGHDTAHRWLEWLGAVRECECPLRGKRGETFYLYAWRKPDVLSGLRRTGDLEKSAASGRRSGARGGS